MPLQTDEQVRAGLQKALAAHGFKTSDWQGGLHRIRLNIDESAAAVMELDYMRFTFHCPCGRLLTENVHHIVFGDDPMSPDEFRKLTRDLVKELRQHIDEETRRK